MFEYLQLLHPVPIYNACQVKKTFPEILPTLHTLPRYDSDLQRGSCAVVGYTVSTYQKKDSMLNVSFNIHWVMLLGLPKSLN
jgi:hypothetical protein